MIKYFGLPHGLKEHHLSIIKSKLADDKILDDRILGVTELDKGSIEYAEQIKSADGIFDNCPNLDIYRVEVCR